MTDWGQLSVDQRILHMTPAQLRRCREAARELAAKAARQHEQAVEWARDRLKPFAQVAADGERLVVTTRREDAGDDMDCHVTALTQEDATGAVIAHHHEIGVTTTLELTGKPDAMGVGYRTRVRAVLDGVMLTELRADAVVGAIIT